MQSFQALTGLRGICALLIVCGHFFTNFAPIEQSSWPSVSLDYFAPVTLFFIISGFLLGVLYQDKLGEWKQRKVFWVKRFARLAPMYYFSLIFCLPSFIAYSYSVTWSFVCSAIFTPTFLQSATEVGNDWSGPLWQISAFALCYVIYPFTLKWFKSKRGTIICALAFYLIPLILLALAFALEWPLGLIHTWAIIRDPHFFIGVILGLQFPTSKDPKGQESNQPKQGEGVATQKLNEDDEVDETKSACLTRETVIVELLTLFLLALFVSCLVLGTLKGSAYWWTFMLWEEFAVVPFHCLWIYYLCRAPLNSGITIPFFCSWMMEKLGEISYSLYVMHWPLLNLYAWLKVWRIPEMQSRDRGVLMGFDKTVDGLYVLENYDLLSVLGILVCISLLTHHYIENPARDWLTKKLTPVEPKKPAAAKPMQQINS